MRGQVWGSIWHGTMEQDGFRRAWLRQVAVAAGSEWVPDGSAPGFSARREGMIDLLADAVEEHLDVPAIMQLAR